MAIKPKTKAMADKLLSDPKTSATQAYIDTHKTTNRNTAKVNSTRLLQKPEVKIYMQQHITLARNKIVELATTASKEDTQLKASQDILDRAIGKAIQKTETTNTNLNLNVETSIELKDSFTEFLKTKTSTIKD